ncbi:MAG: FadR family transcriptional regulator [Draconibacterium sp.]|nr:FadR family transcriptional regulator [Draconibacterium sp.]
MMITKFSTTTLADKVEEQIIEYIKKNSLVPGDSLPNEMQFVEMYGISRNVVREALSRLRMLGLIQTRTKRGIIITEPSLLNGFRKIIDPHLLSTKTIKEMMGMRIVLEIGVAEFLFANINDSDILELEQIVSRQQAIGINNLSIEDEMVFHAKIYKIAGNNFISQFNEIMHPVFVFARHNYESYFKPVSEELNKLGEIVTHNNLLEKIKKRDKYGYQNAIRGHLKPYWEFIYNYPKIKIE